MTTEKEKAKRYDEALEWMRELYPGFHGETKEDAEHYFPELKESEDERIRKELIGLISCMHDADPRKKRWIAYLEKQKEQPKEELVYRLNGLMQEYVKEGEDDAEKEHRLKCYQLFWDALEDADFFEQREQKPNHDKEKLIKHCIGMILTDATEKRFKDYGLTLKDCLTWLSVQKEQKMLAADLEKAAYDYVMQTASGTAEEMETLIDVFKAGASTIIDQRISLGYLISWYIQSVDGHPPIWTEEHLKELDKDFILIPKPLNNH